MAVPLDTLSRRHGVPPPAPLAMPSQDLRHAARRTWSRASRATRIARWITFGGALALTAYATREMVLIVSLAEITLLQWVVVALFVPTFAWIALAATAAIAGTVVRAAPDRGAAATLPTGRTALVMPVYNEDPARTVAALAAMGRGLIDLDVAAHFEIFILSDTRDSAVWLQETAATDWLRATLGPSLPVWYRRRMRNEARKAGNIRDFLTHWGARYEHMVVLDADSIIAPDTLVQLVAEMNADPACGILQTFPRLCGGRTLFARLQQFAGTVYGPVVARGIAAWQGDDGNYWGHNAIIRTRAFAAAAGLPTLRGRAPFGGDILSHDFVEAALVRRAGWSVRMLPHLGGSWEEAPPSLLDAAARDRRWAQGNLQHLAVIGARGLRWPNRVHLAIGVMSYLAAPLWLALIVAGLATATHVATADFDYFRDGLQLFPSWPVFDAPRMVRLFTFTMGVLLLPKFIGLLQALRDRRLRLHASAAGLTAGTFLETVGSVLYAPVFMLMHSAQVWEILRGRDAGWQTQQRTSQCVPWRSLWQRHRGHMAAGIFTAAVLAAISPPLLAWMAPVLLGLVLAVPLSAASGWTPRDRGTLLDVPEDQAVPPVMRQRDRAERALRAAIADVSIDALIRDPAARRRHFRFVPTPAPAPRGKPDLLLASAAWKLADAVTCAEALDWLDDAERLVVLGDPALFAKLAALDAAPRRAGGW